MGNYVGFGAQNGLCLSRKSVDSSLDNYQWSVESPGSELVDRKSVQMGMSELSSLSQLAGPSNECPTPGRQQ